MQRISSAAFADVVLRQRPTAHPQTWIPPQLVVLDRLREQCARRTRDAFHGGPFAARFHIDPVKDVFSG
jgi:hypothetical protein